MALSGSSPLASTAIRIAAAGLGAAVAGPLGGAIGAAIGNVFGPSAAQLITKFTERFGEEAGKKLYDTGTDSIFEKLKPTAPDLESAYREAFRRSLLEIGAEVLSAGEPDYGDWFANWDVCLKGSGPLRLPVIGPMQLVPECLDALFRNTMERLDGEGARIRESNVSIKLVTRSVPDPLLDELTTRLPGCLRESFRALIVQSTYEQAWKQAELVFQELQSATLGRVDERTARIDQRTARIDERTAKIAEDLAAMGQQSSSQQIFVEQLFERYEEQVKSGVIMKLEKGGLEDEIVRLTNEVLKLQRQLAARSAEPAEAELSRLLYAGDLDSALRLKSQKVEQRRQQSAKLPRDLVELGVILELRFEWPQALDAYREAWELGKDPDHGSKYADFAAKLHRFSDAITTYQALLGVYTSPTDRAATLYSLGNAYRETHQLQLADEAYGEAYDIYMSLAADPAYMQDIANTLNNIGVLYCDMGRLEEAEEIFIQSLAMRRLSPADPKTYLFPEAGTLNNLANLCLETHRMKEAEGHYCDALSAYSQLPEADPKRYRFYRAHTLNNLGTLYCDMQRLDEAEEAYGKALNIRRELAGAAPEAYSSDVAVTLTNLANLCFSTQRIAEAEQYCIDAERILLPLWQQNPEMYGDGIARILWKRALSTKAGENDASTSCTLARRALAVAYHPEFKNQIRAFIDRFCTEPVV